MNSWIKRFKARPFALASLLLLVILVLISVFNFWVAPLSPNHQFAGYELRPPGQLFLLGTDELGRDIFSRLLAGTKISLEVSVLAVGLASVVGTVFGLLAGYLEGWFDTAIMRISDTLQAFPAVIAAIAVDAVLGPGVRNIAFAIAIVSVPAFTRQIRAGVLSERGKDYIESARALGASDLRIMALHIFPNVLTPLLVQVGLGISYAVNLEAGLGFLGLGVQPPNASLGAMLNHSLAYLHQAPWFAIFPGAMLTLLLLSLNFTTFTFRDLLDPRQKSS